MLSLVRLLISDLKYASRRTFRCGIHFFRPAEVSALLAFAGVGWNFDRARSSGTMAMTMGPAPEGSGAEKSSPSRRKYHFGDIYRDGRYEPLHAELFAKDATWKKWLAPSFEALLAAAREGDPRPHLREEAPGVYSFQLFSPEFCDMMVAEVEHARQTSRDDLARPNGMNRHGLVLNQLGLEPLITSLQQEHLVPIQSALFPQEGGSADDHHSFIISYSANSDVGLDMHEDDSDVTLNVCLGKEFSGATLCFCGRVADDDHRKQQHIYTHEKGRAVMHLGRHRHGADNIASGERMSFLVWSINDKYRASDDYNRHRLRSTSGDNPDPICLSYTHDRDYLEHLPKPSTEQALSRGVMLDVVERRHARFDRPVHDLSKPIEEINEVPSLCLFMEGLPPPMQHAIFGELMMIASDVRNRNDGSLQEGKPSLLFFIAPNSVGAVPQVRSICGVNESPAVAILDIDKACRYRLTTDALSGQAIREFVDAFLQGTLKAEPLRQEEPQSSGGYNTEGSS